MNMFLEWYESNLEHAPNQSGVERMARCPNYEEHKNGDRHHSFRFNVSEGVGFCFACNLKGNAYQLAQQFGLSKPPDKNGAPYDRIPEATTAGEKRFLYYDLKNTLQFMKLRSPDKRFFIYGPDGKPGLKGQEPILYNLRTLSKAATAWVVEGEPDVNNLKDIGITATTSPFGANDWRDSYSAALKDKELFICGDQDDAGRGYVEKVAASNSKYPHPFIKLIELPDMGEGGDISDFLATFDTREQKRKAVEALEAGAKDWVAPALEDGYHRTDLGNARRLIDRHGEDLRYVAKMGWFHWTGSRFALDETGAVNRMMKETVRSIYTEGVGIPEKDERKKLIKYALSSEANHKLKSALEVAETEPEVIVSPGALDKNIDLFNLSNGTLNLRTLKKHDHQREDLITKLSRVKYDAKATAPLFLDFMQRTFQAKQGVIGFVRRSMGYFLTGDTSEQCFWIWSGVGANGKSTLLRIVRALLGEYAKTTETETLLIKRSSGISNDLAALKGARLVTASESEQGKRLAESLIKQITGGESLSVRFLHKEFFEYVPTFKVVLVTNHKPVIRGGEHAIWRRVHLVPFDEIIPDDEQDKELPNKIIEQELSGVLNFALMGLEEYRSDGLKVPEEVHKATSEYRKELDVIGAFLADQCEEGELLNIPALALYTSFKSWAEANGEYQYSKQLFGRLLSQRGFTSSRDTSGPNKGRNRWHGLALRLWSEP